MSTAGVPHVQESDRSWRRRRSVGQSLWWDASLPEELVERIWCDANSLLADGPKLQHKPRCSVARIQVDGGSFVWKRHNWGNFSRTLRKALSRSVAKQCAIDGRFLNAAGVPTPLPRLYLERWVGPINTSSYLLTDYVEGTSLYRYMRFEQPAEPVVVDLAQQVAAIWQKLNDLLVQHNDFQTSNFVVDPQGKLWLIDLERMRRHRRVDQLRRKQIRDIHDLLHPRNWRANPEAAELFRLELLRTQAAIDAVDEVDGDSHPLSQPVKAVNRSLQLATVFIPCRNAADTILACLESVRDIADEIVVADAGSTDETLSLVRSFGGCRIIHQDTADMAAFESWACEQARHSWILRVLPNEQLNPDLGREVQSLLATEPVIDGYFISRSLNFRGHSLKHGHVERDVSLRLFQKHAVHFHLREGQVEAVPRSNRIGRLTFPLVHESCSDLRFHIDKMVRTAGETAEMADAQGEQPSLRAVLWNAPWQFFKSYFLRGSWLDGWAGLHASILPALAIYLHQTLLWEWQQPVGHASSNTEEDEAGPTVLGISSPYIGPEATPLDEADGRQIRAAA